ncbi:MAG TPA: hypothetical protein VFA40_22785, partial [Terriglobales bacterium]|nr:hypothetical protein [Terriglobales bacterium]
FSNCCEMEVSPFAVLVVNYFTGSMRARPDIEQRIHPSPLPTQEKGSRPLFSAFRLVYVASLTQDRPVG